VILLTAGVGVALALIVTDNPAVWTVVWMIFGAVAICLLVLADGGAGIAETGTAQIDPSGLHSVELREAVRRAIAYQSALRRSTRGAGKELSVAIAELAHRMSDPIEMIYELARSLDAFREERSSPRRDQVMDAAYQAIDGALADFDRVYRMAVRARAAGASPETFEQAHRDLEARAAQLRELHESLATA
jgi:hypothetical protein